MASRKVIDWSKVKGILAPQDFALVNEQRARHHELARVLTTQVPKIDFDYYKRVLQNQALVSDVEKSVAAFKPQPADVSDVMASLNEQEQAAIQAAEETVSKVESTVSGFKKDLEAIKSLAHYDDIRPEDVYEAAPGLEKVYYDRLRQGKVFHDDHNFGEKFL